MQNTKDGKVEKCGKSKSISRVLLSELEKGSAERCRRKEKCGCESSEIENLRSEFFDFRFSLNCKKEIVWRGLKVDRRSMVKYHFIDERERKITKA